MPNVIEFSTDPFKPAVLAVARRWAAKAPTVARWFVQDDPDTGDVRTVTDDGGYIALAAVDPNDAPRFYVQPTRRGRWELYDTTRQCIEATFNTLDAALESVCRTHPDGAA